MCAKYCKHKAAYWKLHMGHILEQAELEAAKAKAVQKRKQSKQQQRYKRDAKSMYFLLKEAAPRQAQTIPA